jgi:hypothetical protein
MTKVDRLKAELKRLTTKDGLDAERAVLWAEKHPRSALHASLEWDNGKAGHLYRVWQVRALLINVIVEPTGDGGSPQRIWVSPKETRGPAGGYQLFSKVMSRADLRALFLAQALDELERVCSRYNELCELAGVREQIRLVREKLPKAA